ncbi:MAG: hypothetical protein AB4042_20590 [Leptolyngbyaceae cyanobacterium]
MNPETRDPSIHIVRLPKNPIIQPGMPGLEGQLGSNINGPSLIRVPDWIENPLGRYYLYFAHHLGEYIRLAYADHLAGPWHIHEPGTLHLRQTKCQNHIASPDVHVNENTQEIWMYFHGCYPGREYDDQVTMLATSRDGLHFTASPQVLGPNYFRVFRYGEAWYAIANNWYGTMTQSRPVAGQLLRSSDGVTPFEPGPDFIPNLRHAAVWVQGERLFCFYSRYGDTPERVLLSWADLGAQWHQWSLSAPITVAKPEMDYEGVAVPTEASVVGVADGPRCELRDPAIFSEGEKQYLLYAVAGEQGIAIAELYLDIFDEA